MNKPTVVDGKIFCALKNKSLIATPEEIVRQEFIYKLVEEFGYSLDQMAQEKQVTNSQRGQGRASADIVIWKSAEEKTNDKKALIVVECKAESIKIKKEDYYQGFNYAAWAGASFFVTTNNKETKYFNVDKDYLPKELQEIVELPKAEDINDKKKIKELLEQTKAFSREEFTKVLFGCHNIIRNNDKLSPEAAFDEISKILFMKINFERDERGSKVFTKKEYERRQKIYEEFYTMNNQVIPTPFMQDLFRITKEKYKNDNLFENNEVIKIKQNSFVQILEKLEKYNLSNTSDDVKGIAFEEFLGRTFRGELGQFFTPRTIVDFMTEILDPQENETVCDPCCGSGGFLIKTFEYIRTKIEIDTQDKVDRIRAEKMPSNYDFLDEIAQGEITKEINSLVEPIYAQLKADNTSGRLYNLSHNCIYGTDANPRMARTSKMNMIMHGDGHGGVHHHDGLLDVNGIFEDRFDVILTNPPFGSRVDKDLKVTKEDRYNDEEKKRTYLTKYGTKYQMTLDKIDAAIEKTTAIKDLFYVGKELNQGLTEVLFVERCLRLLKPGGRLGIVLPEGVLNTSNLQKVREYFESQAKLILICSIPQDVFIKAGATVKPSLVFFKKFTEEERKNYDNIVSAVTEDVTKQHADELNEIETLKQTRQITAKEFNIKKKSIVLQIEEEIKPIIKERFDYQIPIAKVEKAGITTTGAVCENELEVVAAEFREYNNQAKLWDVKVD